MERHALTEERQEARGFRNELGSYTRMWLTRGPSELVSHDVVDIQITTSTEPIEHTLTLLEAEVLRDLLNQMLTEQQ